MDNLLLSVLTDTFAFRCPHVAIHARVISTLWPASLFHPGTFLAVGTLCLTSHHTGTCGQSIYRTSVEYIRYRIRTQYWYTSSILHRGSVIAGMSAGKAWNGFKIYLCAMCHTMALRWQFCHILNISIHCHSAAHEYALFYNSHTNR